MICVLGCHIASDTLSAGEQDELGLFCKVDPLSRSLSLADLPLPLPLHLVGMTIRKPEKSKNVAAERTGVLKRLERY
jgi:hypothetical protein